MNTVSTDRELISDGLFKTYVVNGITWPQFRLGIVAPMIKHLFDSNEVTRFESIVSNSLSPKQLKLLKDRMHSTHNAYGIHLKSNDIEKLIQDDWKKTTASIIRELAVISDYNTFAPNYSDHFYFTQIEIVRHIIELLNKDVHFSSQARKINDVINKCLGEGNDLSKLFKLVLSPKDKMILLYRKDKIIYDNVIYKYNIEYSMIEQHKLFKNKIISILCIDCIKRLNELELDFNIATINLMFHS